MHPLPKFSVQEGIDGYHRVSRYTPFIRLSGPRALLARSVRVRAGRAAQRRTVGRAGQWRGQLPSSPAWVGFGVDNVGGRRNSVSVTA